MQISPKLRKNKLARSFVEIHDAKIQKHHQIFPENNLVKCNPGRLHVGERQNIAQEGVRAIDARTLQLEMAQVLHKRVFALPGCQRMSLNVLMLWGWLSMVICVLCQVVQQK